MGTSRADIVRMPDVGPRFGIPENLTSHNARTWLGTYGIPFEGILYVYDMYTSYGQRLDHVKIVSVDSKLYTEYDYVKPLERQHDDHTPRNSNARIAAHQLVSRSLFDVDVWWGIANGLYKVIA